MQAPGTPSSSPVLRRDRDERSTTTATTGPLPGSSTRTATSSAAGSCDDRRRRRRRGAAASLYADRLRTDAAPARPGPPTGQARRARHAEGHRRQGPRSPARPSAARRPRADGDGHRRRRHRPRRPRPQGDRCAGTIRSNRVRRVRDQRRRRRLRRRVVTARPAPRRARPARRRRPTAPRRRRRWPASRTSRSSRPARASCKGSFADDRPGIKTVKLRLAKRAGGKCWYFSGKMETFRRTKCGTEKYFAIGDKADWSLPASGAGWARAATCSTRSRSTARATARRWRAAPRGWCSRSDEAPRPPRARCLVARRLRLRRGQEVRRRGHA